MMRQDRCSMYLMSRMCINVLIRDLSYGSYWEARGFDSQEAHTTKKAIFGTPYSTR